MLYSVTNITQVKIKCQKYYLRNPNEKIKEQVVRLSGYTTKKSPSDIMSKPKVTIKQVFKTIIWPRRKLIGIGLILIVISRLAGLVLPLATKYLIDDVIAKGDLYMLKMVLIAVVASITDRKSVV